MIIFHYPFSIFHLNVWPICLTFGDKQMMCDGSEMLYFAIDDGARYSFELSDGALAAVDFDGSEMLDAIPIEWYFPWEYRSWPCMVTLHVDSAHSGWIGRTAVVSVDGLDDSHFFPNDSETVTAVVTNCHEDAYIDCTWTGGEGISFSDNHSLTTTINWNSTNGVAWATNYVDLVTTYEGGYAITNRHGITVGTQTEPTTCLELLCPTNMFINSAHYSNYVERVYSAVVKVTAPHGSRGQLWLDADEGSGILLYADRERTTMVPPSIPIGVPEHGEYGTNVSFFVVCPRLGMGRIEASLFLTNGIQKVEHVDVLVIEPERRLVTDELDERSGIIVNPSRLVYGTNAVLKVGVHQSGSRFNPMNITWHPISGNCRISPTNGLSVVVEPTTDSGVAVVEARFNDDAVQPRFVLPIVRWRELAVKAFVVQPPQDQSDKAWTIEEVNKTISAANSVYSQIGVRFNLQEIAMEGVGTSSDWVLQRSQVVTNGNRKIVVLSNQAARLFDHHKLRDCIELYFVGHIIPSRVLAFHHPYGVAISREGGEKLFAVAHEIGHALGLEDCYALNKVDVMIGRGSMPVQRGMFSTEGPDWGDETSHGFYGLTDSLELMLQSMLMCGNLYGGKVGVDIPDDWIESLGAFTRSPDQTTHAAVGARTVESKTDAEIYSR